MRIKKIIEKISEPLIICSIGGIVIILFIWIISVRNNEGRFALSGRTQASGLSSVAVLTAGQEQAVYSGAATIDSIVIGQDVTESEINIFDDTTAPGSDQVFYFYGNVMRGSYLIGTDVSNGIFANITNQTDVFIYYTPK